MQIGTNIDIDVANGNLMLIIILSIPHDSLDFELEFFQVIFNIMGKLEVRSHGDYRTVT